mgnify:CR=1 FL=1
MLGGQGNLGAQSRASLKDKERQTAEDSKVKSQFKFTWDFFCELHSIGNYIISFGTLPKDQ